MATNVLPQDNPERKESFLRKLPQWQFHFVMAIILAIVVAFSTWSVYQEALADAAEERAEAADEEEAAAVELDFEIEDAYAGWAWGLIAVAAIEMFYFGWRRRWTFASTVQVGLIVLLVLCFLLITQQEERDVFRVGTLALIVLTLIQVAFGNISPEANFRQSMVGLAIAAVIISAVVALSIWLVPYLIQLGS